MTLSLDSNVIIDLANGDNEIVRHNLMAAERRGEHLKVSPPVLHEVMYGALISTRPLHQSEVLHRVLSGVSEEPFSAGDARVSAQIRAQRRRLGRPIGPLDAMIAAQALMRGWTVITADEDDFGDIPDLSVLNWRVAAHNPRV